LICVFVICVFVTGVALLATQGDRYSRMNITDQCGLLRIELWCAYRIIGAVTRWTRSLDAQAGLTQSSKERIDSV
jgi:hypothetical protein